MVLRLHARVALLAAVAAGAGWHLAAQPPGAKRPVPDTEGLKLTAATIADLPARIGCHAKEEYRSKRFFDGTIDELVIFDRALTEEEIKTLYRMGVQGQPLR